VGTEPVAGEPATTAGPAETVAENPSPGVTGRPMRAVKGTGETVTRGLSEHIEASAIEKKLTDTFGDLPEYQRVSMADQAAKVLDLINKDCEAAKALGQGLNDADAAMQTGMDAYGSAARAIALQPPPASPILKRNPG
jgi:hypothetical protein